MDDRLTPATAGRHHGRTRGPIAAPGPPLPPAIPATPTPLLPAALTIPVTKVPWLEPLRGRGYLFADLQTRRGHSGGPVYLPESGDVVGVCVSVMFISRTQGDPGIPIQIHHGTAATLVIPAREVVRLLDEHGVPWREAE